MNIVLEKPVIINNHKKNKPGLGPPAHQSSDH